ncbi:histidine kinase [Clostridia bacterium]|nr:histidine kinase [Clostridia bacterium]
MIKKLRIRFLLVNMSLLLLTMLGVFSGIFVIMYHSEIAQSEGIIEHAFVMHESDLNNNNHNDFFIIPNISTSGESTPFGIKKPDWEKSEAFRFEASSQTGQKSLRGDTIFLKLDSNYKVFYTEYQFSELGAVDKVTVEIAANKIFESDNAAQTGIVEYDGEKFRYKYEKIEDYYAVVLLNRANEISVVKRLISTLWGIGAALLVVLLTLSFFLSKWLVAPTAQAYTSQTRFVSDAAHELKTPLTVIATNIEAVLSNPNDTVEEQKKWLVCVRDEAMRMSKLTNELLKLTKGQANKSIHTEFNLSDVVNDICINFEVLIFEKNKTLETNIKENVYINGNLDSIKQLVTILVDNAIKYSTDYAILGVILKSNKKVELVISNTGSEIPQEDIPHIFDRFYRVDSSRTKSTGGFGLGLSIAKNIADEHNAKIYCKSLNNSTSFIVEFIK